MPIMTRNRNAPDFPFTEPMVILRTCASRNAARYFRQFAHHVISKKPRAGSCRSQSKRHRAVQRPLSMKVAQPGEHRLRQVACLWLAERPQFQRRGEEVFRILEGGINMVAVGQLAA